MKYSFDASAFVGPYRHSMPPDIVPSLWRTLGELIQAGEIVASKEVLLEISQKDDELFEWVKAREEMFIEVDTDQQETVRAIMARFPDWVGTDLQKNKADPYVVALAKQYGLIVVSTERGGSESNPKIPYVCQQFGVKHLSFLDFLRAIGWSA
jgi:hypothetical protein